MFTHASSHMHIHICKYAQMHVYEPTYMYICTGMHIHICIYARPCTYMYMNICNMFMYIRCHTYAHTLCAHICLCICSIRLNRWCIYSKTHTHMQTHAYVYTQICTHIYTDICTYAKLLTKDMYMHTGTESIFLSRVTQNFPQKNIKSNT